MPRPRRRPRRRAVRSASRRWPRSCSPCRRRWRRRPSRRSAPTPAAPSGDRRWPVPATSSKRSTSFTSLSFFSSEECSSPQRNLVFCVCSRFFWDFKKLVSTWVMSDWNLLLKRISCLILKRIFGCNKMNENFPCSFSQTDSPDSPIDFLVCAFSSNVASHFWTKLNWNGADFSLFFLNRPPWALFSGTGTHVGHQRGGRRQRLALQFKVEQVLLVRVERRRQRRVRRRHRRHRRRRRRRRRRRPVGALLLHEVVRPAFVGALSLVWSRHK